MDNNNRAQWTSKLGFILAAAGSAVGLGNIWKFPGKAYENGGGAFIIIYIAIVILIGIPVMMSELTLGRNSQANTVATFRKLNKKFTWVGYVGVFIGFLVTSYYVHVGGWVLRYIVSYITEHKNVYADPQGYFFNLLGMNAATGETFFPWVAILFAAIFMIANIFIVVKGVEGGIEKFNKVGMPALFVILIILLIRSVTLPGAAEGVKYMITPDFSQVTGKTFLVALGQAFFSLSLGMAIMITYGSYLPKTENISKNAAIICGMDTCVALLAGFIIVPAVFATLGEGAIGKGGSFAFISLAGVFEQMPAGWFFGILFYMLLLFAALTSSISLIEGVTAFLTENFHWKRKPTVIILGTVMFLVGCLYTISQAAYPIKGIWFDFVNGITFPGFGDFMEYLSDCLLIPLCALATSVFVGWVWKPKASIEEVRQNGKFAFKLAPVYAVLIKYLVPVSIAAIIITSFVTGTVIS